jgi:hypothetical protein
VQLTAAWVRRKRFEAGLLAQALYFGGGARPAAQAAAPSRDEFFDMLTAAASQVVEVGAADGDKVG